MPTLLISGSRHWHDDTYTGSTPLPTIVSWHVEALVERAGEWGWSLIAGDAPGVDHWAAREAWGRNIPLLTVGLSDWPRHGVVGRSLSHLQLDVRSYTKRDHFMVEQADHVMCVWNGKSLRTAAIYAYAMKRGKAPWLSVWDAAAGRMVLQRK
jgi:hypothetical protein